MSVLKRDYAPIEKFEFVDKEILKTADLDKESRLDLKALTTDGTMVNIEIQTTPIPEYLERSLYY